MRKMSSFPLAILLITVPAAGLAQSPGQRQVAAAMYRDGVNGDRVDAGTRLPVSVGKLSCFTKIAGVESSRKITHV
jgi:hypothetical protein